MLPCPSSTNQWLAWASGYSRCASSVGVPCGPVGSSMYGVDQARARKPSAAISAIMPCTSSNTCGDMTNVLKPVCQPSSNQSALEGMWRCRYCRAMSSTSSMPDQCRQWMGDSAQRGNGRGSPARRLKRATIASGSGSTKNQTSSERPSKVTCTLPGSVAATSNAPASRDCTNRPHPADETRNGTGTCSSLVPDSVALLSVRNMGVTRPRAETWVNCSPRPVTKLWSAARVSVSSAVSAGWADSARCTAWVP